MNLALPRAKPLRFQTLALLCVWVLLVSQGVIGLTLGCGADANVDQTAIDGMGAMPASSGDACPHCHPRGESCASLHGCNAQSAVDVFPSSRVAFVGVRTERAMPPIPQATSLSFPPPLRPPAA